VCLLDNVSQNKLTGLFCGCRGLYITINDIGHVHEILCNWPEPRVKVGDSVLLFVVS
jgi:hypothetical protein